jgi:anti-sigma factor RsiW
VLLLRARSRLREALDDTSETEEMAVPELSCRELVEIVTDYLENQLSPTDRRRFEEHLLACDGCANYLEQMRKTIGVVGRLSEESLPAPVRERLLRAFRDWKSRERPVTRP